MLLKDLVKVYDGNIFLIWGDLQKEFHKGEIPNDLLKMKVIGMYLNEYHVLTVRVSLLDLKLIWEENIYGSNLSINYLINYIISFC